MQLKTNRLKSIICGCALIIALPACGTTKVTRVASAAPIQYKTGTNTSYNAPSRTIAPQIQTVLTPNLTVPTPAPQPRLRPTKPKTIFDQSKVDTDLYAHQRVGRSYKVNGKRYSPKHNPKYNKTGKASWYGPKFNGKPTATGELFDMTDMTAAHKTLPLNSMAYVTNLETGEGIMVRINDRGPFVDGRIIDLSKAAATKLGVITHGTAKVRVQYAGPADPMAAGKTFTPKVPTIAPVRPEPKSVPMPTPQANEDLIAQANPKKEIEDGYQPLRRGAQIGLEALGGTVSPQTGPRSVPTPRPLAPTPYRQVPSAPARPHQPYMTPSTPMSAPAFPKRLPEDRVLSEDDVITLTIDGPIHMAGERKPIASLADPSFRPATYKKVIQ